MTFDIRDFSPLPFPFSDVLFLCQHDDATIDLTYVGTPERLIAAAAIEPHMAERNATGKRPRVDSQGSYFHREVQIVRSTLSTRLVIYRQLRDPTLAAKLPGGPSALRFERLDWLDANPGRLSIADTIEDCAYWPHRRSVAGTTDMLVRAGYPESLFDRRWNASSYEFSEILGNVHSEYQHIDVRKLMRGYFEVIHRGKDRSRFAFGMSSCSRAKPSGSRGRVGLRLVWDNPQLA